MSSETSWVNLNFLKTVFGAGSLFIGSINISDIERSIDTPFSVSLYDDPKEEYRTEFLKRGLHPLEKRRNGETLGSGSTIVMKEVSKRCPTNCSL
ncbi:hypothetical protein Tco_0996391 [Tanacetum coccineum]